MMKRNILAVIVPALLVAGTANAAEIYNKDGNKVDLYGKAVGLHYFSKGNGENSYGGNGDMTYARLGFKGETQINSDLTGYGQWEYKRASARWTPQPLTIRKLSATRLARWALSATARWICQSDGSSRPWGSITLTRTRQNFCRS